MLELAIPLAVAAFAAGSKGGDGGTGGWPPAGYTIIPGQPNAAVNPETREIVWLYRGQVVQSPQTQRGEPATDEQLRSWGVLEQAGAREPSLEEQLYGRFLEPSEQERRYYGAITDFISQLSGVTKERAARARPVEELLFSQAEEALRTGGIGARIPLVQQALERSKQATSRALGQTGESLTRVGLTGTPYGQRTLGEIRMMGEQASAQVPTDITAEFLSQVPNLVLGTGGQVISGLTGGAGAATGALNAALNRALGALSAATSLAGQRSAYNVAQLQAQTQADIERRRTSGAKGTAALSGLFNVLAQTGAAVLPAVI